MTVVGTHAQDDLTLRVREISAVVSDPGETWLASILQTHDVVAGGYGYVGSFRNSEGSGFGKTKLEAVNVALGEFVARQLGLPPPQHGPLVGIS